MKKNLQIINTKYYFEFLNNKTFHQVQTVESTKIIIDFKEHVCKE